MKTSLWALLLSLGLAAALGACSSSTRQIPSMSSRGASQGQSVAFVRDLPEPYDVAHASYIPKRTTMIAHTGPAPQSLLSAHTFMANQARHIDATVTSPDNGGQAGFIIKTGSASGVGLLYAVHDAYGEGSIPLPTAPGGYCYQSPSTCAYTVLYAPTAHGPNGNCLEAGTEGSNPPPDGGYDNALFVYNFCTDQNSAPQFIWFDLDQDFFNTYVTEYSNSDGQPQYVLDLVPYGDGSWHPLIWNVQTNQWDDASSGGPEYFGKTATKYDGGQGWGLFETHFGPGVTCPVVPSISAGGYRIETSSGQYNLITSSNSQVEQPVGYGGIGTADCFNSSQPPYYAFSDDVAGASWTVVDPNGTPTPRPTPTPTQKGCAKCCNSASSNNTTPTASPRTPNPKYTKDEKTHDADTADATTNTCPL